MNPTAIIVGGGPSGISMAHELQKAGIQHFDIYEAAAKAGGVWHHNTYPRCGCDVPSHLYSFSFNKNPDWSQELADQPEIERYMDATIDKLGIRAHIHVLIRCMGAEWDEARRKWVVSFRDERTKVEFTREADLFISCVGAISIPKDCTIPGHESFKGVIWHSARWNHDYDVRGKRIAVVGNGCSAAQFVPWLVEQGAQVTQYARSQQWYHERPNHRFTAVQRFLFRHVPGLLTLYRSRLFVETDSLLTTYLATPKAQKVRSSIEKESLAYMQRTAPAKYHKLLTPDYPLGCKRRVFDPGYLACLHSPNIELRTEGISRIEGETVISPSGHEADFDAIILATGYKVQEFLSPLEIKGTNGKLLSQHWKETRGAQAYRGTFVSGFPNFSIIFGPNSFPAHNSVIYTSEVQCQFTRRAMLEPILYGKAAVVDVKQMAENRNSQQVQLDLKGMVWESGCSNWYLNEWGRNTASYPGYAFSYWLETLFPCQDDFDFEGATWTWPFRKALYKLRRRSKWIMLLASAAAASYYVRNGASLAPFLRSVRLGGLLK